MMFFLSVLAFAESEFSEERLFQALRDAQQYRSLRQGVGLPTISEESYQKAAKGQIVTGIQSVPGYEAKVGWGVAVLKAPIDDFCAGINDGEAHTGKTPIAFAQVIAGEACMDKRQMLMILPIPLIRDRWWIIESNINTPLKKSSAGLAREMSWSNVPNARQLALPEDLKGKLVGKTLVEFTKGAWFIVRLDKTHILGEYHTWAVASNQLPFSMAESIVQSSIVKTMRAMEAYASTRPLRCLEKMP